MTISLPPSCRPNHTQKTEAIKKPHADDAQHSRHHINNFRRGTVDSATCTWLALVGTDYLLFYQSTSHLSMTAITQQGLASACKTKGNSFMGAIPITVSHLTTRWRFKIKQTLDVYISITS